MKITFLGTGTSQGVPVIACPCEVCASPDANDKRLRTSIMLEEAGNVFVIDCGPDFRQQMLKENVKKLDALVFTHEHKDHTAGLDDVRAFNYVSDEPANLFATTNVQRAIMQDYTYIFSGADYPGIPKVTFHLITTEPFTIRGTKFIPISVWHMNLPVLGFRVGDFTYITDANKIPDKEMDKIRGSKVIVLNALRRETHVSHFNLDEAVKLLRELKPKRAFLTHISHQLGMHAEINKELPLFIRCAYDGLKLEV
ncbi:MAG TPA: MBL fold metallo-hydrolase [Bacteroidia bacterium]|nr:MBL fold metallo-hydrolase [Bacteroidia bacterium]